MNVKPGDLAIVVDDGSQFENLGLIVNVISFEGSYFWWEFGSQPSWLVEAVGSRGLCYWRSDHELYFEHQGKMPDCCLKRIDPDLAGEDFLDKSQNATQGMLEFNDVISHR